MRSTILGGMNAIEVTQLMEPLPHSGRAPTSNTTLMTPCLSHPQTEKCVT